MPGNVESMSFPIVYDVKRDKVLITEDSDYGQYVGHSRVLIRTATQKYVTKLPKELAAAWG